jgi:hypothetical protein
MDKVELDILKDQTFHLLKLIKQRLKTVIVFKEEGFIVISKQDLNYK